MIIIVPKYEYVPKNAYELMESVRKNELQLINEFDTEKFFSDSEYDRREVFVAPNDMIDFVTSLHPFAPKYHIIPVNDISHRVAIGVRKNFCCMGSLNVAIKRAMAAGIYQKVTEEYKHYLKLTLRLKKRFEKSYQPLSVDGIKSALFILIGGLILSTLVLLVEISYKRFH